MRFPYVRRRQRVGKLIWLYKSSFRPDNTSMCSASPPDCDLWHAREELQAQAKLSSSL